MAQEIPGAHLVGDFGQKALIVKDGKVLMCRGLGDTRWDLPGGRLHTGEDLAEGLRREVKEEMGLDIEVGDPFFITVWYGARSGMPRVLAVYTATLTNTDAPITLAADEIEEARWVSKEEVGMVPMDPEWTKALTKFFSK